MGFFLFRTVTANLSKPNVCRLWIVEGDGDEDARAHFAEHVRYRNPRLEVFEHDGDVTGAYTQVTPRIREI